MTFQDTLPFDGVDAYKCPDCGKFEYRELFLYDQVEKSKIYLDVWECDNDECSSNQDIDLLRDAKDIDGAMII